MKIIRVDLREFETKQEIQEYLKKECDFPEYYGCNLDALYDCLSENNDFYFEIVESEKYETYVLSLMKIFRKTQCEYDVIEK